MSIAAWLLGSKIGQTILLVIVGFIGFGWYTIHERDIGEAKAKAAEAAAAQAQLEQVQQALEAAQQEAQQALAAQHKLELDNEKLLAAISATRPHDSDAAIGADDASMLNAIGAQPGPATARQSPAAGRTRRRLR